MNKNNTEEHLETFLSYYSGDVSAATAALRSFAVKKQKPKHVASGPVVVSLENVSKKYKLGRENVNALKNVSLEIKQGEFVALTGSSGSGKSTLLQLIGALDKPSEGRIIVDGQDISTLSDGKLSVFRNKTVGFVFQFFYLQPFLDIQTNIEVPAMFARTKKSERIERSIELATAVGLVDRVGHRPKELSGGQMQRAAIARALLNKPKILLADEPTGNLDSKNGMAIIDLFETARQKFGTTIIMVTHDPKIAYHADREIVLHDGEII